MPLINQETLKTREIDIINKVEEGLGQSAHTDVSKVQFVI